MRIFVRKFGSLPVFLHHRILGEGPALIILHGLFGSLNNWQTLARRFAAGRAVHLLDQRNHGRSPHDARHDYVLLGADLLEYMDQQGLRDATLLGHSMGGKVAMQAALAAPGRVERLIVVDIAPRAYDPAHDDLMEALASLDLSSCATREEAEARLAIPDAAVRQFLLTNLKRDDAGRLRWRMNLPALRDQYPNLLRAVTGPSPYQGPALFVAGGSSTYVRHADEAGIRSLFPRSRIVRIQGAGHWVHAERPEEFAREVELFLAGA
jgi:esterase